MAKARQARRARAGASRRTWSRKAGELLLIAACTAGFVGVMVPACAEARRASDQSQARASARTALVAAADHTRGSSSD